MRRTLTGGLVLGLVAALGFAAPAHATETSAPKAVIGLFHGIPDVPVDVYVGKTKVADDFQPGTFAGPLMLDAGVYTVRITSADATSYKHPLIKKQLRFGSGKSHSVIAHLSAKGKPVVTKYTNDTRALAPGEGRVTVRHVAAAPRVDVLVDGTKAIKRLKNPNEVVTKLPSDTYEAAVTLAGKKKVAIGPVPLEVKDNFNTIVYAWGSAEDGTLQLTTRQVALKPYTP